MRRLRLRLAMWFLPDGCTVNKSPPTAPIYTTLTTSTPLTGTGVWFWDNEGGLRELS